MLAVGANKFNFGFTNLVPSITPGTAVTPGGSHTKGSWVPVASAANLSTDVYGVRMMVYFGGTSGTQRDHLLDLGVDPAGSTAYVARISNLVCGQSEILPGFREYYFPLFIAAGSSVAVRIQENGATPPDDVWVIVDFYGGPSRPDLVKTGQYSETIGTITDTGGVAFTPGSSGAEGAWTSLGTTTQEMFWWQIGAQVSSGTQNIRVTLLDLAFGDESNKTIIISDMMVRQHTQERTHHPVALDAMCPTPAGSTIYIRGSDSGTPNTGWNAVAVGVG